VMLAELPEDSDVMVDPDGTESPAANRLGLVVKGLSAEEREMLGIAEGGVLVKSVEAGPAQQGGIRAGDIIINFNGQPVSDTQRFGELLDELEDGQSVAVLVQRGDGRMFYPIRLPSE
jgi:serine protease Do